VTQLLNFLDFHLAKLFDLLAIGAYVYKFYTSSLCLSNIHDVWSCVKPHLRKQGVVNFGSDVLTFSFVAPCFIIRSSS